MAALPQTPLLVRYEPLVRISFVKPRAEMSLAELLEPARELRALRPFTASIPRGAVYQELARLELLIIDAAARHIPDATARAAHFDPSVLFPDANGFPSGTRSRPHRAEVTPAHVIVADGTSS